GHSGIQRHSVIIFIMAIGTVLSFRIAGAALFRRGFLRQTDQTSGDFLVRAIFMDERKRRSGDLCFFIRAICLIKQE
ncbi:MAG: hypothetical protein KDE09_24010, partial [Anaerolineales bacterium]|nr:hypothetical protein [Anaerolineales bacterium]